MKQLKTPIPGLSFITAILVLLASTSSLADTYEVTVTNLTKGLSFTPRLVFSHTGGQLFNPGAPAIDELISIAESGNVGPMMTLLASFPQIVIGMELGDGLIMPGDSQTLTIDADPGNVLTLISMLIPTNDAFIALNGVTLPTTGRINYYPSVYDAGSETNDEICANIPGPACGGAGDSPDDAGEGYIYTHPGIHGIGDLEPSEYDWNNPVAIVVIRKL
ncbi:MAG: spondin domain-containing protein [Gammaproteobacteria bacterium]|jgi:hypothetical protein